MARRMVLASALALGGCVAVPVEADTDAAAQGSSSSSAAGTDGPGFTTQSNPGDDTAGHSTAVPGDDSAADDLEDSGSTYGDDGVGTSAETGEVPDFCDPFAQDCPDGYKCGAYADGDDWDWNANACFPIARDPAAVGEPCTTPQGPTAGPDDCAFGSMCWGTDDNAGTCVALCVGSAEKPTCAEDGTACVISNDGSLNLCLPTCDPVLQDCAAGDGCYPTGASFQCAPDGSGAGGGHGSPCGAINGCDPGTACVVGTVLEACAGGACCSSFCDVSDPGACQELGAGWSCLAWYPEGAAPEGLQNAGICGFQS